MQKRLKLRARVFQSAALDEKVDEGNGKGKKIRDDDGERRALGAVQNAGHIRHEQYARYDHHDLFDQIDHAVGHELFISPEHAADDRIYRVKGQAGQ